MAGNRPSPLYRSDLRSDDAEDVIQVAQHAMRDASSCMPRVAEQPHTCSMSPERRTN